MTAAVVAYGVCLAEFGSANELARTGRNSLHVVTGDNDGVATDFLVTFLVDARERDLVFFEPSTPRRHLWDEALNSAVEELGLQASSPGWMLFFAVEHPK